MSSSREEYLEQQLGDLRRVLDASMLLASSCDLDTLLTRILEEALALAEAEASAFFLVDPDKKDEIICAVTSGGADARSLPRLKRGQGIVGTVIETGDAICIPDAYADDRFNPEVDKKTGFRTRSILCVPLIYQGEVIGAGQVINRRSGEPFNARDLDLLQSFCIPAAAAIHAAHMHQQVVANTLAEQEAELAREVQQSFLPSAFPETAGVQIDVLYEALRQVGGDVYDARICHHGKLGVYLGDVTGKGMSAALFAARFQAEISHYMGSCSNATEVAESTNKAVCQWSQRGLFLTQIYLELDARNQTIAAVNAGHPPPLLKHADGRVEFLELNASPPIGIVPMAPYQHDTIVWEPGATLILYSDGVIEARNRAGEFFGKDGLLELARQLDPLTPRGIQQAVDSFAHTVARADDLTILSLHFEA